MNISIIIPYRDRLTHLQFLVPNLRQRFPDAEIIVVEQNDSEKFQKASLLNVGVLLSQGDTIILHDVDYYPNGEVTYLNDNVDVYLPVKFATFVDDRFNTLPLDDIPSGYRHFHRGVDDNFFGGVLVFKKDAFRKINGSNYKFVGWGLEDAELRRRALYYGLTMERDEHNHFQVMGHRDSAPPLNDPDFQYNQYIYQNFHRYLNCGISNQSFSYYEAASAVGEVDRWIKATNFEENTGIISSIF